MHWKTKLVQPEQEASQKPWQSLAPATYRGSTVVFPTPEHISDDWRQSEYGYTYGSFGTRTTLQLGARIAEIEGARHTFITPGGLAAITLVYLTFCKAGSHVLLPANAYAPNKELADSVMARLGIKVQAYDPLIGSGISHLIRPETSLVWCESPGSVTMEVQDLPAIVAAAHAVGVPVALDNSYAAGVFLDAFSFGVDVSMQALTKYVGGHSDLVLGSVSVGTEAAYERVGETLALLGMAPSPDDCNLAMRGLQTLGVRLDALERSTITIAHWMSQRPEIETVLHPALPSCPGHEIWKRDFTGSASLFSVVFHQAYRPAQVSAFVGALKLFKIGYSWGGVTSLAMLYPQLERPGKHFSGRLVRLNIGLEDPADLISDLSTALAVLPS